MKKLLALAVAAMMLLSLVPAFAEETLTLWSIAVESDSSYQSFIDAIAAFEEAHPGVKIVHEPTQNEQYKTKIKAAMNAFSDLPDIFFTWGMSFLGDFVNAEPSRVLCLEDYYPAYEAELPRNMCANASYDGKLYGVPYTMSMVVLFANMDLLAQAGWDHIPETYEDMQKCCDDLLAAGITPFGVSGKETWCLTEYLEPLMIKSVGTQKLIDIYEGRASWNDEGIIAAVDAFQDMVKKGYFDPNAAALGNDEVKNNFIAGKYAFYQNGSWNCGDISKSENAASFKAGLFPVLNPDNASLYELIGGPNNTLAVAVTTENPELAATAAFELGRAMSDADYKSGANLPCWAADPEAQVSDLVAQVVEIANNAVGMVLFGDNFLSADAANTYLDYVQQAYFLALNANEFAEGIDADMK